MKTAPTIGSSVTASAGTSLNSSRRADMVFTLTVAVIMCAALIQTFTWPSQAAVFPRVVIVSGLVFSLGLAAIIGWKQLRRRNTGELPAEASGDRPDHNQDDDAESDEAEYVFATAGTRAWVKALLWVTGFLILTGILGIFASSGIFALFYLRWGAHKSWKFSGIYAVVLTLCLLTMFRWLLYIPTPVGILTSL
ncbi:tripartite tricarboxylate transporter TctB family protein [[Micrococcus luteus] ATCC 49442]|uniref:tripartite tricarboxylate transporter TctB family protein n=1 Tax=[Micrococcus luteus] ATCC 49442 TaxID=2698727 RepID=UPI0013DA18F2|nr:tripartite tricarboxylate transporter TctB family protein [[Micrococcus luteus] ATCC 49442]